MVWTEGVLFEPVEAGSECTEGFPAEKGGDDRADVGAAPFSTFGSGGTISRSHLEGIDVPLGG